MYRILSIGILFVLWCSCSPDKKKLGPANANFLLEIDSIDSKKVLDPPPSFEHPYLKEADSLRDRRDHQRAIRLYQRAAEKFEAEENWEGLVKAKNEWGHCYYRLLEYNRAIEIIEGSLVVAEKHLSKANTLAAETHFYLGKCFHHNFEASKSLRHHQVALGLRRELYGEWSMEVADSYEGLGRLYQYRIGDLEQAESNLNKTIEILEIIGGSDGRLSSVYNALANNYRNMSDFHKALDISKIVANRRHKEDSTSKRYLNAMAGLANVYSELEDTKTAIDIYNFVINTVKAIYGSEDDDLSNYYNNLGAIYIDKGDSVEVESATQKDFYDTANFFIQKGKQIAIRNGNLHFLSNCYFSLGRNYTQLNQFDSAYFYFEQCKLLDRMAEELISREIGTLYEKFDSLEIALIYYQQALGASLVNFDEKDIYLNPDASPELGERVTFEILSEKASVFRQLYHQSRNLKDLEAAFDTFLLLEIANDYRRNSQFQEASKLFLINYYQTEFGGALQTAVELYQTTRDSEYLNKVFYLMEKSKSMLLFKAINGVESAHHSGVPDSILIRETQIKSELASLRRLLSLSESNANGVDQLQEKLLDLTQDRDRLSQYIQQNFPAYYQFKYDSVTLALTDVQKLLNQEHKILTYYWGDSLIYLMSITKDQATINIIAQSDSLQSLINNYIGLVHNPPKVASLTHEKEQFEAYQKVSYNLYQQLVKPALVESNKESKIIIVPDGPLSQIPFESLTTSNNFSEEVNYKLLPYLNKRDLIYYGYSVNLLFNSGSKPVTKTKPNVLAFGYKANETVNTDQEALPGSTKEISALNEIVKGQFYMGKQASKKRFKENAASFDILHLAVHGTADLQNALNSKLHFQNTGGQDSENDLYAYELYGMNLSKTQLAVLSACETGVGKQFKGEGTFSIARGFAYAGVPSIIMSLWKVDDAASAELMKYFYQEINSGKPVPQALAQAKANYIVSVDQYKSHPAYWASFISLGNASHSLSTSIAWYDKIKVLLAIVGLGVVLLLGFNWAKKKAA